GSPAGKVSPDLSLIAFSVFIWFLLVGCVDFEAYFFFISIRSEPNFHTLDITVRSVMDFGLVAFPPQ
ncbi:MAG: hypothetical protein AABY22_24285, partial [Nanoarchaeota archaeon]